MNKYIGITGATGVLGRIFQKKLTERGLEFSCFDGDIRSKNDIVNWVKGKNFTSLFHLAAIVPTKTVNENPQMAFDVNVNGTKNLIEILDSLSIHPWLFYASTSHVYRGKDSPITENDPIDPMSEYGKTKYEAEKIVSKYNNACIGRIFSFYHPTQTGSFLYPTVLNRLSTEDLTQPFKLMGAESVRDFLNAEDVVEIALRLMDKKQAGVFNIASGTGTKISDFVQKLTDKKLNIVAIGEKNYLIADIDKLNKALSK
jgi:nucleoside-diphosphate-sugar epimerase